MYLYKIYHYGNCVCTHNNTQQFLHYSISQHMFSPFFQLKIPAVCASPPAFEPDMLGVVHNNFHWITQYMDKNFPTNLSPRCLLNVYVCLTLKFFWMKMCVVVLSSDSVFRLMFVSSTFRTDFRYTYSVDSTTVTGTHRIVIFWSLDEKHIRKFFPLKKLKELTALRVFFFQFLEYYMCIIIVLNIFYKNFDPVSRARSTNTYVLHGAAISWVYHWITYICRSIRIRIINFLNNSTVLLKLRW